MNYPLCDNPWDQKEKDAIFSVMRTDRYTMGENVCAMEKAFAEKMGSQYAVMVNSGSSANLLAIAALCYSGRLCRGDEVVVPAVSWSTTYAPLQQFGLKAVFVDINKDTLNMDVEALGRVITDSTRMIFAVNLLGNPNDFDAIQTLIAGRNILLIEDNCESLGAVYKGRAAGSIGLLGTYSSFYSHHICTMEGGFVVTNDQQLYEYMLAIRAHGWTRNLPKNASIYTQNSDSFYESFNFIVPGFNLRPLEMEAAIGLEQLKKMKGMIEQRRKNAAYFLKRMAEFPEFRCQKETGESSWFGFSVVLTGSLSGKRGLLIEAMRAAEIETRPIVAGNFTRNSVIRYMDYTIPEALTNSDELHENGFFVGNHTRDNHAEVDYFASVMHETLDKEHA